MIGGMVKACSRGLFTVCKTHTSAQDFLLYPPGIKRGGGGRQIGEVYFRFLGKFKFVL